MAAVLAVLAVLAVGQGCGGSGSSTVPAATQTTTTGPDQREAGGGAVAAEWPAGCTSEFTSATTCNFVRQIEQDATFGMSAKETKLATTLTLPDGSWALRSCELEGDVTVACVVAFDADVNRVLKVSLSHNGEFNDGEVTFPNGEKLVWEVVGADWVDAATVVAP